MIETEKECHIQKKLHVLHPKGRLDIIDNQDKIFERISLQLSLTLYDRVKGSSLARNSPLFSERLFIACEKMVRFKDLNRCAQKCCTTTVSSTFLGVNWQVLVFESIIVAERNYCLPLNVET